MRTLRGLSCAFMLAALLGLAACQLTTETSTEAPATPSNAEREAAIAAEQLAALGAPASAQQPWGQQPPAANTPQSPYVQPQAPYGHTSFGQPGAAYPGSTYPSAAASAPRQNRERAPARNRARWSKSGQHRVTYHPSLLVRISRRPAPFELPLVLLLRPRCLWCIVPHWDQPTGPHRIRTKRGWIRFTLP